LIADLADAVVAALNGETFSQSFTAARTYLPVSTQQSLQTLRVTVVPLGPTIEGDSRAAARVELPVQIGVQKKLDGDANADIDPLVLLAEEIADYWLPNSGDRPIIAFGAGGAHAAYCVSLNHDFVAAVEHLDSMRVLTCVMTVTFRKVR